MVLNENNAADTAKVATNANFFMFFFKFLNGITNILLLVVCVIDSTNVYNYYMLQHTIIQFYFFVMIGVKGSFELIGKIGVGLRLIFGGNLVNADYLTLA